MRLIAFYAATLIFSLSSLQAIAAEQHKPCSTSAPNQDTSVPNTQLGEQPNLKLTGGKGIHEQVRKWTQDAGWKLIWNASADWVITSTVDMGSCDMLDSVEKLVTWLNQEGKPIKFTAYKGNKVLVAESLEILGGK